MLKTLMWSKTDTIIHTKKPFYGGDTFFRSLGTCALGFFFYPPPSPLQEYRPLQDSLRTGLIPYLSFAVLIIGWVSLFAFVVGFIGRCGCLRLLSDWLGVVVCVCYRIDCSVSLFAFAVGFIGRC